MPGRLPENEYQRAKTVLLEMMAAYPKSIGMYRPLEIGAHKLINGAWTTEEIQNALRLYTASISYLQNMVEHRRRYRLNGTPADLVPDDQAHGSEIRLKKAKERWTQEKRRRRKAAIREIVEELRLDPAHANRNMASLKLRAYKIFKKRGKQAQESGQEPLAQPATAERPKEKRLPARLRKKLEKN